LPAEVVFEDFSVQSQLAASVMRRNLELNLQFTAATGHEHPHLRAVISNYAVLLGEIGRSPAQIRAQLEGVSRSFGMQIGFREHGK
jgi:hypothetical protein